MQEKNGSAWERDTRKERHLEQCEGVDQDAALLARGAGLGHLRHLWLAKPALPLPPKATLPAAPSVTTDGPGVTQMLSSA